MDNEYDQDGLKTPHNHDFMQDPLFCEAYQRGLQIMSLPTGQGLLVKPS